MKRFFQRLFGRVPPTPPAPTPRVLPPVVIPPRVAVFFPPPAPFHSARYVAPPPPAPRSTYAEIRRSRYGQPPPATAQLVSTRAADYGTVHATVPAPRRFERQDDTTELYLPAAATAIAAAGFGSSAPAESGGGFCEAE